jgi:hypothetical protein
MTERTCFLYTRQIRRSGKPDSRINYLLGLVSSGLIALMIDWSTRQSGNERITGKNGDNGKNVNVPSAALRTTWFIRGSLYIVLAAGGGNEEGRGEFQKEVAVMILPRSQPH